MFQLNIPIKFQHSKQVPIKIFIMICMIIGLVEAAKISDKPALMASFVVSVNILKRWNAETLNMPQHDNSTDDTPIRNNESMPI